MLNDALYDVIKRRLKTAKKPLDCNDILDTVDVRQMEQPVTGDDVSNALAALWRRGLLERYSVHRGHGRGPRYSYSLRRADMLEKQHEPTAEPVNLGKLEVKEQPDGALVFRTDRLQIVVRNLQ